MNSYLTQTAASETQVRSFMNRTYTWMFAGLVLTAVIAYLTGRNEGLQEFAAGNFLFIIIAQFAVVFGLSFLITKINSTVAGLLFMGYAALTGLTFSIILQRYTQSDVTAAFLTTAGTFGAMSAFGYFTQRNLSAWGRFGLFAVIGLVIAILVNNFLLHSGPFSLVISGVGVLLFAGLTAYDTQKLRQIALSGIDGEMAEKTSIYGALSLYLDFVNMFLFILRLFGAGGGRR